jgi:hypothetical protein
MGGRERSFFHHKLLLLSRSAPNQSSRGESGLLSAKEPFDEGFGASTAPCYALVHRV